MKRAHSRVVLAMGGDTAFAEMLERLPLSPQDHDIINLSAEVAGWSDDLMARPKAKAKAKSNAAVAPSDSNGAAVASVMPVASDPNARVASNAAKSPPPQGPPPQVPPQHPLPNAPPVRMNMPPPRPPPPAVAAPLTVDQLLDEARAKAPGGAPNAPAPIEDANPPPVPNAPERPMCCICQDFVSEDPNENTCPPCGHVFHADCVRRIREVADQQGRILPENYCSFRCHESLDPEAVPNPEAVPEQELNHEVERDRAEIEELFN